MSLVDSHVDDTLIAVDTASDDLWEGQRRLGINMRGSVERVTLTERVFIGDDERDGYDVQLHYASPVTSTWVAANLFTAHWPMIEAGQPCKPRASSIEVHLAIVDERKRIIASWNQEMDLLGEHDTCNNMMAQLQPWFERMVNEVLHDIER